MTSLNEDFMNAVGPTLQTLRDLADVVGAAPERHNHLPGVPSKALHEIDEGKELMGKTDWEDPVGQTHQLGGFVITAMCDFARGFADVFNVTNQSIYGHLVLARCFLEAGTVAQWLNQVNITTDERVRRGLCERLYSAYELQRLALENDDPDERVAEEEGIVTGLGWSFSNKEHDGKPKILDTRRPAVEKSITALLSENAASKIGHNLWCLCSAVSHVTWYGLRQGVVHDPGEPDFAGRSLAGFGVDSNDVLSEAWLLLIALRRAAQTRFELMGWDDGYWRDQAARFGKYTSDLGVALAKAKGLDETPST